MRGQRSTGAHVVYRLYDQSGVLIYVGCTANLEKRMTTHQQGSWWFRHYATMTVENYSTRAEAHAAERAAIGAENPRWNIMHRSYNSASWTVENYRDYVKAIENQEGLRTKHRQSRLDKARQLLASALSEQTEAA